MQRFTYRWGPNPALPASNVSTAIGDEVAALEYITWNAFQIHYVDVASRVSSPQDTAKLWFSATEWGFNVGRRDCEIYMNYMFRLNRERHRDDLIISGLGAFASALVTATSKSATTLSILAASFGLATAVNDAVFDSYLFSEAPGLISIKVKQLQDNYQQQIETNQQPASTVTTKTTTDIKTDALTAPNTNVTDKTTTVVLPITTAHQAYSTIQNYYHICLPQSIEGVLLQAVADATAKPSSPSSSSTPKLAVTAGK